jgi:hypothetical protein
MLDMSISEIIREDVLLMINKITKKIKDLEEANLYRKMKRLVNPNMQGNLYCFEEKKSLGKTMKPKKSPFM